MLCNVDEQWTPILAIMHTRSFLPPPQPLVHDRFLPHLDAILIRMRPHLPDDPEAPPPPGSLPGMLKPFEGELQQFITDRLAQEPIRARMRHLDIPSCSSTEKDVWFSSRAEVFGAVEGQEPPGPGIMLAE